MTPKFLYICFIVFFPVNFSDEKFVFWMISHCLLSVLSWLADLHRKNMSRRDFVLVFER